MIRGSGIRIWTTADKQQEILGGDYLFYEDIQGLTTIWLEGIDGSPQNAELSLSSAAGSGGNPHHFLPLPQTGWRTFTGTYEASIQSDSLRLSPRGNLTAYRPIHEPGSIPLGEFAVSDADEDEADVGPGIRINFDDDDHNGITDALPQQGAMWNENDLIRLDVERSAGAENLVLDIGAGLAVWTHPGKAPGTRLDTDGNGRTDDLEFSGDEATITFWVEWILPDHGEAEIQLIDTAAQGGPEVEDVILFHTFQSLIIGLSGETFTGWQPIFAWNDPVAQGTFRIARDLMNAGFDVQYFDNQTVEASGTGQGLPLDIAIDAIQHRSVTHMGIFGYSHGGGATYQLSRGLRRYATNHDDLPPYTLDATAYIDAVRYDPFILNGTINPFAEFRRPIGTQHHGNWYQDNGVFELGGCSIPGSTPNDNLSELEYQGAPMNHTNIDDYVDAWELVQAYFKLRMSTR